MTLVTLTFTGFEDSIWATLFRTEVTIDQSE